MDQLIVHFWYLVLLDAYLLNLDSWHVQWLKKWKPLHLEGRNNLEKSWKISKEERHHCTFLYCWTFNIFMYGKMWWHNEEYKYDIKFSDYVLFGLCYLSDFLLFSFWNNLLLLFHPFLSFFFVFNVDDSFSLVILSAMSIAGLDSIQVIHNPSPTQP